MKKIFYLILTSLTLVTTSCGSYTGNGTLVGTGAGAAIGAGLGMLFSSSSDRGKGAAIGAAIGSAVGAGTGALIGRHMDKKKAALEAELANQASVETFTDANGLTAIKVTFDADMTFATGKANLSTSAKAALTKFAAQMATDDMVNTAIQIKGHTDNTGTAAVNEKLSLQRAQAVGTVLKGNGIATNRLFEEGCSFNEPVADNGTVAGRKQNRRVEVYVLATDAMVQQYSQQNSGL